MAQDLPNIIHYRDNGTAVVDSDSSQYRLEFEKGEEFFSNKESLTRFLKDCERLVRLSKRYTSYINYLKTKIKLNQCQVLSQLTDDRVSIEMHHGPIFTLYDYCEIILDHFLSKGLKVTSFQIANRVLNEHWANRIQVVMLSTSVHEEVTVREIFLSMQTAWGDLHKFLSMYKLNDDLKEKYNRYVDMSMMIDTSTYEILKLNDKLFKKQEEDDYDNLRSII